MTNPNSSKKVTKIGRNISERIQERTISNVWGRINTILSTFSSQIAQIVPSQYRWLIPFVQEELGIETLRPEELLAKLRQQEAEEKLGKEALIPQVIPPKPLPPEYVLLSHRGIQYQLEFLIENEDISKLRVQPQYGYLYQGFRLPDRHPVIIREYFIPDKDQFGKLPLSDIQSRKKMVSNTAEFGLGDGRTLQDCRIFTPKEVIVAEYENQNRYYFIYDPFYQEGDNGETGEKSLLLSHYWINYPHSLDASVYYILYQSLQSLHFLHRQKFLQPNGRIRLGLSHGNLNSSTILIVRRKTEIIAYLCDLLLWETPSSLIPPPPYLLTDQLDPQAIDKDLKDLGKSLCTSLQEDSFWDKINPELKTFIRTLMGEEAKYYHTAEIARQDLQKIKKNLSLSLIEFSEIPPEESPKKKKSRWKLWLLLSSMGLIMLIFIVWQFNNYRKKNLPKAVVTPSLSSEKVSNVPPGVFRYWSAPNSIWDKVLNTKNLIGYQVTFNDKIQEKYPSLELSPFNLETTQSNNNPLESFLTLSPNNNFPVDFLVTMVQQDITDPQMIAQFESVTIAYDALVFFVDFSTKDRKNSLPNGLNGHINYNQLKRLYTNKVTNWQEITGDNLPVRLYIPDNPELIAIFEKRVLQDQESIDKFRELIDKNMIEKRNTRDLMNSIRNDFEKGYGGIGFNSFREVFDQCSIYPLALGVGNFNYIAPVIQTENQKAISPDNNLCLKGSYSPNYSVILNQTYPLAYPISILYPRDNRTQPKGRKFAEIMETTPMQCYLKQAGLIPLTSLDYATCEKVINAKEK